MIHKGRRKPHPGVYKATLPRWSLDLELYKSTTRTHDIDRYRHRKYHRRVSEPYQKLPEYTSRWPTMFRTEIDSCTSCW